MAVAKKAVKITENLCKNALCIIDRGLSNGLTGSDGKVCVEYAIAVAAGVPEDTDGPRCVNSDLRSFKIQLNDGLPFDDDDYRAAALRRIAIAQLGTDKGSGFSWKAFQKALFKWNAEWLEQFTNKQAPEVTLSKDDRRLVTQALDTHDSGDVRAAIDVLANFASDIEDRPDYSSYTTNNTNFFTHFAPLECVGGEDLDSYIEGVVQILKKLKTKGSKFLYLTESKKKFKLSKEVKVALDRIADAGDPESIDWSRDSDDEEDSW